MSAPPAEKPVKKPAAKQAAKTKPTATVKAKPAPAEAPVLLGHMHKPAELAPSANGGTLSEYEDNGLSNLPSTDMPKSTSAAQ